jgi:hypothetical protein
MLRELLTRLPDIQQPGPEAWAATSLTSGRASLRASFSPTKRMKLVPDRVDHEHSSRLLG